MAVSPLRGGALRAREKAATRRQSRVAPHSKGFVLGECEKSTAYGRNYISIF